MYPKSIQADIVIINSNIITLDPTNPHSEAIAIKYGRILSVGTNNTIQETIGESTKILDLKNKTVLPGFIDTHFHLLNFGLTLKTLNLEKAKSIDEILSLLKVRVQRTPDGAWAMGRGWNENKLSEKRLLTRWDLDKVSPNNPVYLHHYTCHSCVVNSRGLDVAKINSTTKPPPGGWIEKNPKTGEPTGLLRSNARFLVPVGLNEFRPRPNYGALVEAVKLGAQEAVKAGLTSIHALDADHNEILICQKLASNMDLPLRVTLAPKVELLNSLLKAGVSSGLGNEWVKIGPIKIFSDGSLIAHTSAMLQPFNGEPNNVGLLRDKRKLTEQVIKANRAGMQLAIHATGDRAIGAVLDAYEKALIDTPCSDHRHRIEHGSVLSESLISRIKRLQVVISTQPEIVTKFGDGFESTLGPERMKYAYPYKSLIESGVVVSGSSDCPLTFCSPLKGIEAAITRVSENTGKIISAEERVSLDEAVSMYTTNAAYVGFDEKLKGTIEKDKLADLVVLQHDPWSVPVEKLGKIEVEMTIVGGKIVYRKEKNDEP